MEEKLLKLLTNIHEAKTLIEINDLMGLKTPDELRELQDTLTKLIDEYKVFYTNGKHEIIANPSDFPDKSYIEYIEEPFIKAFIIVGEEYIGPIMELCQNKRGIYIDLEYIDNVRRKIVYELPLTEIIFDFFNR